MLNYNVVVLPATTSRTTCHRPSCRCHYSTAQLICACIAVYVSEIFHPSTSYAIQKYSHIITAAKIYYFVFLLSVCRSLSHATDGFMYASHPTPRTCSTIGTWFYILLDRVAELPTPWYSICSADNYSAGKDISCFFCRIWMFNTMFKSTPEDINLSQPSLHSHPHPFSGSPSVVSCICVFWPKFCVLMTNTKN
jgi:hypothetical protein